MTYRRSLKYGLQGRQFWKNYAADLMTPRPNTALSLLIGTVRLSQHTTSISLMFKDSHWHASCVALGYLSLRLPTV